MTPNARNAVTASVAIIVAVAGFMLANLGDPSQLKPPEGSSSNTKHAASQLLALTLPDPSGNTQALSQWKGKLLVVNLWATWCAPCREEMPGFARLQTKYAAKGVQFVGIAFDSADKVTEFLNLTPVTYPLLIGGSALMPLAAELGNGAGGLPFTLIIGRDGWVLQTRLGIWKEASLGAILDDLAK